MKTEDEVKREFREIIGLSLPIYTFKGKRGVIYDHHFLPMDDFLAMEEVDCYDNVCWITTDAAWAKEGEEITDAPIRNEENNQMLLVDGVWSTVSYNKSDEYVRELLITTDKHYNWTSERKRMIDSLTNILTDYDSDLEYYSKFKEAGLDAEEERVRDELLEKLKERITSESKSWKETCSRYDNADEWELSVGYDGHTASFSSVLKETLGYGYCELVCKTAERFYEKD